jgi:hypothetical protein
MWLSNKKYHILDGYSQRIVRIFNYPFLLCTSPYGWSFRIGSPGIGINVTTNPLFSVRNGYKKSIKLGKYYIVKL